MPKIVDIIAPSGAFPKELLSQMTEYLAQKGWQARIPADILGEDPLCANTEAIRFERLKQALYSEDSDLIWCVRGGYGATPLLSELKNLPKPQKKKNLIGFSDITALHIFLDQKWGWQTTHGASLRQLVEKDLDQVSLALNEQILAGTIIVKHQLTPLNEAAKNAHLAGLLTGGNLKLVEASLGTFWQIETTDKILMLEEISEWDYRVARSIVHLQQAGVFEGIAALVLGDFSYKEYPQHEVKIREWFDRFAQTQNFPIYRTSFFGHGKENAPWMYKMAQIQQGLLTQ